VRGGRPSQSLSGVAASRLRGRGVQAPWL